MGQTEDKWIGLCLAVSSAVAIGTSSIITKKGLIDAAERGSGLASEEHTYLKNPIWWSGMITMVIGEVANFAAYTFAPPILVTPLGALSVLIGAVLASFFLNEELGRIGRIGCTLCLMGSVIVVLHAPEDKPIETVDEMWSYAMQPAFIFYCFLVSVFSLVMIYRVAPIHGRREPIVYVSICSLVGSISVMAVKAFGVALKLTFAGNNQLTHISTYVFAIVVVGCIMVQMNYFNKALDQFSTNVVNPIYYVCFSTATIVASLILFQGLGTYDTVNTLSLILGFVVTFLGVYLLNISRDDPHGSSLNNTGRHSVLESGVFPRMSISSNRLSITSDRERGLPLHTHGEPPNSARRSARGSVFRHHEDSVLFDSFPDETHGLTQLNEEDEESEDGYQQQGRTPVTDTLGMGRTRRVDETKVDSGALSPIEGPGKTLNDTAHR